jgi:hypothetical protein
MRTTIRLPDQLLIEAKQWAAETGRTLTAVIEDALRAALARRNEPQRSQPVKLPKDGVGGLRPGVDLDNSAQLRDIMDGLYDPG